MEQDPNAQQQEAVEQHQFACFNFGLSLQQAFDALESPLRIMASTFADALDNDALWKERAKREGRIRTWWLRRQLRRELRK